jgi:tetratricopeptide (TPR) repeat protein
MSASSRSRRLETIEAMIARQPDDPFPRYARAMELRSLGRTDEALSAYREIAERFPSYVPTYLMAAQLAAELAQTDEARSWAERGIEVARAAGDAHALSELSSFLGALA